MIRRVCSYFEEIYYYWGNNVTKHYYVLIMHYFSASMKSDWLELVSTISQKLKIININIIRSAFCLMQLESLAIASQNWKEEQNFEVVSELKIFMLRLWTSYLISLEFFFFFFPLTVSIPKLWNCMILQI